MTLFDRILFWASNLLVGGTGVVYGAYRYFIRPADPLEPVHPAQPFWQAAHVVAAPLLVLAIGHFAVHHGFAYWRAGASEGRASGVALLGLAAPMVLSGYLLQTAKDESWRAAWIAIHLVASLAWLAACLAHVWAHWRARRMPF